MAIPEILYDYNLHLYQFNEHPINLFRHGVG